jgi:protein-S-isoprenylcysteine O-methyltransferase Ste14
MSLTHILRNITRKTIWIYLGAAILLLAAEPTLISFVVGLVLVGCGEAIRVWCAGYLRKNQILVTYGPYGHVKNPMYIGTILITVGFCIAANAIYFLALALLGFIFYYIPHKRRVERSRLMRRFGDAFMAYDREVDDYLPRLKPYGKGKGKWRLKCVFENSEQGVMVLVTLGMILMSLRV